MVAPHYAARAFARRRMKIVFSISPFYCSGLIYQARPRVSTLWGLMNQTPTIGFFCDGRLFSSS
jgi:hypothetical protein